MHRETFLGGGEGPDLAIQTSPPPLAMPFERTGDEYVAMRGTNSFTDNATGQVLYAGAIILVSESREAIANIVERYGGPLPDPDSSKQ